MQSNSQTPQPRRRRLAAATVVLFQLGALVSAAFGVFVMFLAFRLGGPFATTALLGLGPVFVNMLIAYAMLLRPTAGGARLLLVQAFITALYVGFPPLERLFAPRSNDWGAAAFLPLFFAISIAWADLIVHLLQHGGVFGRAALDQRPEAGKAATWLRIGFAAVSGFALAALWGRAWRPSTPGRGVTFNDVLAVLSIVLAVTAVAVVRRNGWRRFPLRNPFPSTQQRAWPGAVVDVRAALRERGRTRLAELLLGFVLSLSALIAVTERMRDFLMAHAAILTIVTPTLALLLSHLLYRGSMWGMAVAAAFSLMLVVAGVFAAPGLAAPAVIAAVVVVAFVLLRGCLGVWRLKRLRRAEPPIDARSLLRRPRGRRRPSLYASGRVLAVSVMACMSGMAAVVGLVYAVQLAFFTTLLGAESNPAFFPARYLWRLARRYGSPSAAVVRRTDGRRPLLLLRSFKDDGLPMQPPWMFGDIFSAAALTFEEAVTDRLWRSGPVVAIGQPGERIPRAGAAREYLAHDAWQARVVEMAREAGLVCLIIGRTPGVAWEFIRLQRLRLLSKTIVVLPPGDERDAADRWSEFGAALPADGEAFGLVRSVDARSVLLACFPQSENGPMLPFVCDRRTQPAYEAALELAARLICPPTSIRKAELSAIDRPPVDMAEGPMREMPPYTPPAPEAAEKPLPALGRRAALGAVGATVAVAIAAAFMLSLPVGLERDQADPYKNLYAVWAPRRGTDRASEPPRTPAVNAAPGQTNTASLPISPAEHGAALHIKKGCITCHSIDGSKNLGRTFKNLFGYEVSFTDGSHVIADSNYIRSMIVNPNNRIVAGFQPIMPSYQGMLKDETHDVDDLVTYIRTLSDKYRPTTATAGGGSGNTPVVPSAAALAAVSGLPDPQPPSPVTPDSGPKIMAVKRSDVLDQVAITHGDVTEGKQLFSRQGCAFCHTVVASEPLKGPCLADVAARYKRRDLAEKIIDPNMKITDGFITYHFKMNNDDIIEGFMVKETPDQIVLRTFAGRYITINPADVAKRKKLTTSPMPEGIVGMLTIRQFASILDYLQSLAGKK